MRRTRTLAVLASLAIAVGGAGLAKADSSSMAASSSSNSVTAAAVDSVTCTVSPPSGTTATTFTATITGHPAGGATFNTGEVTNWGDGAKSAGEIASVGGAPVMDTHKYSTTGTFNVEVEGHFSDNKVGVDAVCSPQITVGPGTNPCTVEATENGEGCPPVPCEVNADHKTGDGNGDADDKTMANGGTCPNPEKVDCTKEANELESECPQPPPCKIDATHPNGDGDGDADDKTTDNGGSCKPTDDESFTGGTFYAAESGALNVVADASAVNLPSTAKSADEPLAGAKSTDTNCANPNNACKAVKNLDTDKDITNYKWDFEAWRESAGTVVSVEKATVDSGLSPSASHQFTKAQGDDIVVITLTITEDGKAITFHGIKPGSPPVDGELDSPNVVLEPCNQPALIIPGGPSIGDLLVDSGVPLTDPDGTGPLSGALISNLGPTPLGGVGLEVGCLVNTLGL